MADRIIKIQTEKQDQGHFNNITKDLQFGMDKINQDLDAKETKIRTLE